jgi:rSAM/selenodomain-associated transferase 1
VWNGAFDERKFMKAILVLVAKEPVPGKVKTRLSSHLSESQAAHLYSLSIQDMIQEMTQLSENSLAIAYTPEEAAPIFKKMIPQSIHLFPQQGADLGERLANIFRRMFDEGYGQVHILNSDSPDLPHSLVKQSMNLLNKPQTEAVLGPCDDGGYYLVGLRRLIPELFTQIPWSTDKVLQKTLERVQQLGLQCKLLGPWYDIDTYDDILKFLARNRKNMDNHKGPGWRTLRYVRAMTKQANTQKVASGHGAQ